MKKFHLDDKDRQFLEKGRMPFAVYQFIDNRVVTVLLSNGFCELFGYDDKKEAYYDMDHDMYKDTHPDDVARISDAALNFATKGGKYEVIYRSKNKKDNTYRIIHAMGEHVYTAAGERLAHIWYTDEGTYVDRKYYDQSGGEDVDIKKLDLNNRLNIALHEESILKANRYDYLTGLPTMTYFFELAEATKAAFLREGKQPAILFIDLSGMKFYNQKYGFAAGNELLRGFAQILRHYFDADNCSRFGQDHYAVHTTTDGLEEKLEKVFEDSQKLNENHSLIVRVGIYLKQGKTVDVSTACDRAKYACNTLRHTYVSNFQYFDASMQLDAEHKQDIIENLDRALEEHWVQVYYQPIVRATNGKVCDEEALARWIDPVRGFLSPGEFIPALEDAGLIYHLDLYVLEQVLQKIKCQKAQGLITVPQSVNLSRADFTACDIVEEIRKRVDDAGVPHDLITIEVTESIVGSDFEFMKAQIERFQKLGFPVWMDDFGSGYSSLDVLQSATFDLIKFDMSFMQQFDKGDKGKVILTELMKMANGLGIDTVCEGVETKEQVEFLQEIGCEKLQGFYFGKPIPFEEIVKRYEDGIEIGFENPEESEYFTNIGRINLYDLAVITKEDPGAFRRYFNTLPMAILEVKDSSMRFVRSNQSYRDFMKRLFDVRVVHEREDIPALNEGASAAFMQNLVRCSSLSERSFADINIAEKNTVHSFVRRLAVNPVTGTLAIAIAILEIADNSQGTSYEHIAKALAADYTNIFYVNLDTEHFTEYTSNVGEENLITERHGDDFFAEARKDAEFLLHKDDQENFIRAFTKENVVRSLNKDGVFTISYRLKIKKRYVYVNMKAMRMQQDGNYMIAGVSNVDEQTRQREALERARATQIIYNRLAALAGHYICIYIIDPKTEHYMEYSSTKDFEYFGLEKEGEDFFATSHKVGEHAVYPADYPLYLTLFTKEHVLHEVEKNGLFALQYRVMFDGEPRYVETRAALVKERGGNKLIVGLNNIDEQMRQELEYERSSGQKDAETGETHDRSAIPIHGKQADGTAGMTGGIRNGVGRTVCLDNGTNLIIKSCIRLMAMENFKENVEAVLGDLAKMSKADVCQILLINRDKKATEVFSEWIRPNALPERTPDRGTIYYEDALLWEEYFQTHSCLSIHDEEDVKAFEAELPMWKGKLKRDGIRTLAVTPLRKNRETIGFLHVANPDVSMSDALFETLELMSFFLGSEIANYLYRSKMEYLSNTDELTGLKNRHAMMTRLDEQGPVVYDQPFGILIFDLNGLKRVNDTEGHIAGDMLICRTAELLKQEFTDENLYRVGGDEFIVIVPGVNEAELEQLKNHFLNETIKGENISLAYGSNIAEVGMITEQCFDIADKRMYANKKKFYQQHPELKDH